MLNICTFVALISIGTANVCVDYSPHPNGDCTAYVRCVGDRKYIMHCGPGTAFNPRFSGCDYPEDVICPNLKSSTPKMTPPKPTPTTTENPTTTTTTTAQPDIISIDTANACVDYSPHPNGDCTAYVRCVGDRKYIMHCGPGSVFNPMFSGCDYPENVICPNPESSTPKMTPPKPTPTTTENPTTTTTTAQPDIISIDTANACVDYSPHPNGDCTAYVRCVGDRKYIMHCGPGSVFNPMFSGCDYPENVICPNPESSTPKMTPPKPTPTTTENPTTTTTTAQPDIISIDTANACVDYSPHPNGDCTAYVRCVGDRKYIMHCGPGSVFNPMFSGCDYPENVICPNPESFTPKITPPEPTPTTTENPTTTTAQPDKSSTPKTIPPAPTTTSTCVDYPHPNGDCTAYVACDGNQKKIMHCEPGTVFNSLFNVCDYPEYVECPNPESSTPKMTSPAPTTTITTDQPDPYPPCPVYAVQPGRYPNIASGCKSYFKCYLGKVTLLKCPDGLIFDTWTHRCNLPNNAFCGFVPL